MVRYLLQLEGCSSLNLDMWNVYRFTTEIESFEEDLWNTAVQYEVESVNILLRQRVPFICGLGRLKARILFWLF